MHNRLAPHKRRPCIVATLLLLGITLHAQPPPLKWAGDPEGGAPFVEADPADPQKVSGFDVDIADRR
jgi:hypothetical protein